MNVVVLQVFVSLTLVASSILLFLHSVKQADHEHADRLSLLPMEQDRTQQAPARQGSASAGLRTGSETASDTNREAHAAAGPRLERRPAHARIDA